MNDCGRTWREGVRSAYTIFLPYLLFYFVRCRKIDKITFRRIIYGVISSILRGWWCALFRLISYDVFTE